MPKRYVSINRLLNLLISKDISFKINYFKNGKIELTIYTTYFIMHSPIVYLSTNKNSNELINTLMGVIEREYKDANQK